ncbi:hypothetical protein ANN_19844 [Periplaneta americana]|uniref:Hyaluronidase n=1 Tax=Periplaneta americana TaxID=6978 RepID=A0ABQ8SAZ9_PERAM|nr:hypothetical protein ANN_19844 [Periplaneta americana]
MAGLYEGGNEPAGSLKISLGIIDFEFWRPIFRQNWARLEPYKTLSIKLERERHPFWSDTAIKKEAKRRFEKAARKFLYSSLKSVKEMRPNSQWGYYMYPYCFNYSPDNMTPYCPRQVQIENDEMNWLFSLTDTMYPSIFLRKNLLLTKIQLNFFVKGRLGEALRIADKIDEPKPTVNAHFWYKYKDVDQFVSEVNTNLKLNYIRLNPWRKNPWNAKVNKITVDLTFTCLSRGELSSNND